MSQARPHKGQPKRFRSSRATRANHNGQLLLVAALVVGGFTGTMWWGAGGTFHPVLLGFLGVTAVLGTVATLTLIAARRFERADTHATRLAIQRKVADAYREAAPRIPTGLPQVAASGANSVST